MASTTGKTSEVRIKDLAGTLKTEPRALRAFVRGLHLGCGRGTRYAWPSMSDPAVKKIVSEWKAAQKANGAGGEA